MNPVERVIRRIDTAQQRHRVPAFVFGVIKKYGDHNGGVLAANLAHSAFVTVFPLLLILMTVLVKVPTRNLAAGAITGGIAWTVLQALAAPIIRHFTHSDSVYACSPPCSSCLRGSTSRC